MATQSIAFDFYDPKIYVAEHTWKGSKSYYPLKSLHRRQICRKHIFGGQKLVPHHENWWKL